MTSSANFVPQRKRPSFPPAGTTDLVLSRSPAGGRPTAHESSGRRRLELSCKD